MPPPAEQFVARFLVGPTLRTQSDGRLVKLVRDGYEAAFEEIVRRYGSPLRRYAAKIVGRNAEDVTQDAFSKALLAMRRDDNEIELRPWLFRIVRNTALNDLRDRPPSAEALAEALVAGGGGPAEETERREELADLIHRLGALPEPQRAAIVMRELEGLSHEEIAAALGLSGGGARQAIYRARQALREGLGMLLPLPLLKGLMSGSVAAPAEAAAGAAGVGGAGVALKATAATVLVVGAVGAGVAIDGRRDRQLPPASADTPQREHRLAIHGPSAPPGTNEIGAAESEHAASRERSDDSATETSGDGERRGHGSGEDGPAPGSGGEDRGGRNSGPGGGEGGKTSHGESDDDSGGSSGPRSGESESGDDGSGGSGSGEEEPPTSGEDPSSGEGSGSGDDSDSGSSESSGSGGGGSSGQTSDDVSDPHESSGFSE